MFNLHLLRNDIFLILRHFFHVRLLVLSIMYPVTFLPIGCELRKIVVDYSEPSEYNHECN